MRVFLSLSLFCSAIACRATSVEYAIKNKSLVPTIRARVVASALRKTANFTVVVMLGGRGHDANDE